MNTLLTLITCTSTGVLIATVITYERLIAEARQARERAEDHADESQMFLDMVLADAVSRHPSQRTLRAVK